MSTFLYKGTKASEAFPYLQFGFEIFSHKNIGA